MGGLYAVDFDGVLCDSCGESSQSALSRPKVEVLKKLQALPNHEGLTLNFLENRLATLRNVIKDPELDKWNLLEHGAIIVKDQALLQLV